MGMVIETKRLKIIVLTQEQLEMLVDNIPEFEKRLNCSYQGEKIEGIFKNILYEQSLKIEANSDVYLWLTFWLIVKKDDNIAVGMIDFKNIPNENREVEIGYGLGKKRVLFVPTGALLSTVSYNEGQSVPGIAHGVVLEHC